MAASPRRFRNVRHWLLHLRSNVAAKWDVRAWKGPASAWRHAIHNRDVKRMKRYHRAGISAAELTTPSMDSLDRLVIEDSYQELRLVLLSGANANAQNQNSHWDSLLHIAAACGRRGVARLLVSRGANMEALESNGCSALAVALNGFGERYGPWENRRLVALDLIAAGAQVKGFTRRNRQSMLLQLEELDAEVLGALLKAGANPRQVYNPVPEHGWSKADHEQSFLFQGSDWWSNGEKLKNWLAFMSKAGFDVHERTEDGRSLAWVIATQMRPSLDEVPAIVDSLKGAGVWDLTPSLANQEEPLFITFLNDCPDHWWAWVPVLLEEPAFVASLSLVNTAGKSVVEWLGGKSFMAGTIYHAEAGRLRAAVLAERLPKADASPSPRPRF